MFKLHFNCKRIGFVKFLTIPLTGLFVLGSGQRPLAQAVAPQTITNALVEKWQSILGSVPFRDEHLFSAMTCVQPQPDDAFRPFTTETMSRPYQMDFRDWVEDFFRPPLQVALSALKPSKYYLNRGRNEPSLLRYEFECDGHSVVMDENFNFFFFIVQPRDFSVDRAISREAVSELISRWIKVRETNQIEIALKFRLSGQLRIGDVFTNRSQPHLALIRGGQDHVIGFISKRGICLMVPKAQEGRAAAGFHVDFNWVNRQIFEADGTTRMDHPKYFDQAPKAGEINQRK